MNVPAVPNAPYAFSPSASPEPATPNPGPGRPKGSGAKRGRKPRAAMGVASPTPSSDLGSTTAASPSFPATQYSHVHWSLPNETGSANAASSSGVGSSSTVLQGPSLAAPKLGSTVTTPGVSTYSLQSSTDYRPSTSSTSYSSNPSSAANLLLSSTSTGIPLNMTGLLRMSNAAGAGPSATTGTSFTRTTGGEDDGEGDDELLPAMADDDYSAQLSWSSQSKDNLKVLMENFSPEQYERFEAYRRHALPKQAVRKVIQQTLGQQVSQPVAQIVAGIAKVFVGEIVEKARQVQARRGDKGPLSPDHLREAYRMYQQETGNVGAAKPLRAKRLFVR